MLSTAAKPKRPLSRTDSPDVRVGASARAARRWFLILAPVLAGLLAILGAAADPAAGEDGRPLYEAYANDPERLQFKAFGYHFSYALWGFAALLLAGLVRRRGSWLANVAGFLVLLGVTTMPGFILADFYDSAIGQTFGADGAVRVEEQMEGMWALIAIASTGAAGLIFALPVAALAAWRAGLIPWWAALAAIGGIAGGFIAIGANVAGAVVLTAGFSVLSLALGRMDHEAWREGDVPTREARSSAV